jgi:hypothetical protein
VTLVDVMISLRERAQARLPWQSWNSSEFRQWPWPGMDGLL